MMTAAERVIEKCGGIRALSRLLGHRHPTTVQGWKERKVIPSRQQSQVLEAARGAGVELNLVDFFDSVPDELLKAS